VNRRQRRSGGQRGREIVRAAQCPDCDSRVSMTEVAPNVYRADVEHDETCPWFSAFKRDGGFGVRLR
jgi:hypothetical protein